MEIIRVIALNSYLKLVLLIVLDIFVGINLAFSETLDFAIQNQLKVVSGVECGNLLGGNPSNTSFLTGELLATCTRGVPANGVGPSSSTGGSASSPASFSGEVKKRLKQLHDDNTLSDYSDNDEVSTTGPAFFITVEMDTMNRKVTALEEGYNSEISKLILGMDSQYSENLFTGVAFKTESQRGGYIGGNNFESNSYGLTGFGSFLINEQMYFDFYFGYALKLNTKKRSGYFSENDAFGNFYYETIVGDQAIKNTATQINAGFLLAYETSIQNVSFGPRLSLDMVNTQYGTYNETGFTGLELNYHEDQQTSLISTLGFWGSVAVSTRFGVVVIQQSLNLKQEHDLNARTIDVSFVGDMRQKRFSYTTDTPDREYLDINLGVSVVLQDELQFFFNARTLMGNDIIDNYGISLGMRKLL